MPIIDESDRMVKCVMGFFAHEEKILWRDLVSYVLKSVGSKNATRVNTAITALVSGGVLLKLGEALTLAAKNQTGGGSQSSGGAMSTYEKSNMQTQIDTYKASIKQLNEKMQSAETMFHKAKTQMQIDVETAKAEAKAAKEQKQSPPEILEVQVKSGVKTMKVVKGVFHDQFKRVLQLAQARRNIFIYGPTGCGKTHICEQVAQSLNLSFGFTSCTNGMSEGVLTGRLLPTGKGGIFEYYTPEFIRAYEGGGVYLLDEIDAADPNVLLLINSALSNKIVSIPNRKDAPYAKMHTDFICIAAANTVGTGGDRLYVGRNKLDMATLDRFAIGKVLMDYDAKVEAALCDDDELRNHLLKFRKAINSHRLERAMSTRFMADAYLMKHEFGWTLDEIDEAFFQGWKLTEADKVKTFMG